jgi:hypothetical protein
MHYTTDNQQGRKWVCHVTKNRDHWVRNQKACRTFLALVSLCDLTSTQKHNENRWISRSHVCNLFPKFRCEAYSTACKILFRSSADKVLSSSRQLARLTFSTKETKTGHRHLMKPLEFWIVLLDNTYSTKCSMILSLQKFVLNASSLSW